MQFPSVNFRAPKPQNRDSWLGTLPIKTIETTAKFKERKLPSPIKTDVYRPLAQQPRYTRVGLGLVDTKKFINTAADPTTTQTFRPLAKHSDYTRVGRGLVSTKKYNAAAGKDLLASLPALFQKVLRSVR